VTGVGIINCGAVVATDSPRSLIQKLRGYTTIKFASMNVSPNVIREIERLEYTLIQKTCDYVSVRTKNPALTYSKIVAIAQNYDSIITDVHIYQLGLEDVFMELTGVKELTQ
jgi:ABC-type multidrug transport system ATPase subunit